jgi:transposase
LKSSAPFCLPDSPFGLDTSAPKAAAMEFWPETLVLKENTMVGGRSCFAFRAEALGTISGLLSNRARGVFIRRTKKRALRETKMKSQGGGV